MPFLAAMSPGCSPGPGGATDLAVNFDQGVEHVVHVRKDHFVPNLISARVGEKVRFVFDDPGHNVVTVTSAGDMDPVWYPDRRGCSVAMGECATQTSPAGSSWEFSFPYAADWPLVCGVHGPMSFPGQAPDELVWVRVTP